MVKLTIKKFKVQYANPIGEETLEADDISDALKQAKQHIKGNKGMSIKSIKEIENAL